jgi:hypothetical protein
MLPAIREIGESVPVLMDDDASRLGREALEGYILDVLFNPANREGARFRGECLAWQDAAGREALKATMLAAAREFAPGLRGWEQCGDATGVTFAGQLGGFQTTLRFVHGHDPLVSLEVD